MPKLYFFTPNSTYISQLTPIVPKIMADQMKLRIITFNLAYQVQTNQLGGSEKPLVELCQRTYSKTGGWSNVCY